MSPLYAFAPVAAWIAYLTPALIRNHMRKG